MGSERETPQTEIKSHEDDDEILLVEESVKPVSAAEVVEKSPVVKPKTEKKKADWVDINYAKIEKIT